MQDIRNRKEETGIPAEDGISASRQQAFRIVLPGIYWGNIGMSREKSAPRMHYQKYTVLVKLIDIIRIKCWYVSIGNLWDRKKTQNSQKNWKLGVGYWIKRAWYAATPTTVRNSRRTTAFPP